MIRKFRMFNIIDELTHECLRICINRKLKAVTADISQASQNCSDFQQLRPS
jgi:hypothetical protein